MEARLASSLLVTALLRRAEAEGGFGTVLAKGDATAGSITIILTERGDNPRLFERTLQPDGHYAWQESIRGVGDAQDLASLLERRRRFDPDLWIVELDIVSSERFAAEMNSFG